MRKLLVVMAALVMLVLGRVDAAPKKEYVVSDPSIVRRQEVYKRVAGVELIIEIFEPKTKEAGKKYPAIVFYHGGSWTKGNPSQFFQHCAYLVTRGMIAMSVQYRLTSRKDITPKPTVADCVRDGKSALRWVRANATRLGIDPERIAAGGGSAGGHLAAAVAMAPGLEEEGEDPTVSCMPNALALFNPVLDTGPTGFKHQWVKAFFPAISPMHNIKAGTPPTIVFLGTKDQLISVAAAEAYRDKMRECGSRCELRLYEGQEHGFFNYGKAPHIYHFKTLYETDKFLGSLGWIEGEPTITEAQREGKAE